MTAENTSEPVGGPAGAVAKEGAAEDGSRLRRLRSGWWLSVEAGLGKGFLYLLRWARFFVQFVICCCLAILMQMIATRHLYDEVVSAVRANIPGEVKAANDALKPFNVSLCIGSPPLGVSEQGCAGVAEPASNRWATPSNWFSLRATQIKPVEETKPAETAKSAETAKHDDSGKPPPKTELENATITFLEDEKAYGLISNLKIVESVHSMSRVVERTSQATRGADHARVNWTTNLRLCAGTPRLWDDEKCTGIANALGALSDKIDKILNAQRLWVMFFGTVQTFVLSVFLFILIELIILACDLFVTPRPLFFESAKAGSQQTLALKAGDDFKEAMSKYLASRRRHVADRLLVRILLGGVPSATSSLGSSGGSAEAFREFQIGEANAALSGLDIGNEILLKLSFAGTIWGIGSALFYARNLDSLDPISRIVAKASMFSGIGTGFGTTLVGISLSMIASLIIQALSGSWERHVNSSYKLVIDLGLDEIASRSRFITPEQRARLPTYEFREVDRPQRNVFEAIGKVGMFIILATIIFLFRSSLLAWLRTLLDMLGGLL